MPRPHLPIRRVLPVALLLLLGPLLSRPAAAPPSLSSPAARSPAAARNLAFEPNAGQTAPAVRFLAHAPGATLFFTPDAIVLQGSGSSPPEAGDGARAPGTSSPAPPASPPPALQIQWLDANPAPALTASAPLPGYVNYLRGSDPAHWQTHLSTYAALTYQGLYPGVDLTYAGTGGHLKGTYTLAPGADPTRIHWRYSGADGVRLDATGALQVVQAGCTVLIEQPPHAWQEQAGQPVPVAARYALAADGSVGFALGAYDPSLPLVLDPTLIYSTYLGGTGDDAGRAIARDPAGNVYVTGYAWSWNFPTANPYQPTRNGYRDAFISKLNADGSALVYSTYLGGSGEDDGFGIAVDAAGEALVAGTTNSLDFPTVNAIQPGYGGDVSDGFVAKLNADGTGLVYATYLGGNSYDYAWAIAADGAGNAYVTGETGSRDFPTANAFQPTMRGNYNAFVTKFNPAGTVLVYSTFLGGTSADAGNGIAIDGSGSAYVTGQTYSPNFPVVNAFQPICRCGDAFVTKFTPTGNALLYSTFLGGGRDDAGQAIAVDAAGSAYVTGSAKSSDFPLHTPVQSTCSNSYYGCAFVTKFDSHGLILNYSTYLGGSVAEIGQGIAVDGAGQATVIGGSWSPDFPLLDPLQNTNPGGGSFVTRFTAAGSALLYSTYLGGSNGDETYGIVNDAIGNAYITGWTNSPDFPLAGNSFQSALAGYGDAFVAQIAPGAPPPTATGTPPTATSTRTLVPTHTPPPTVTGTPPTATPHPSCDLLTEGFESGTLGAFTGYWTVHGSHPHSGTFSAHVAWVYVTPPAKPSGALIPPAPLPLNRGGGQQPTSLELTQRSPVYLPTDTQQATLSFWHTYAIDGYGGALLLSTDGGNTFTTLHYFPGGQQGWTQETFDLTPYIGLNVSIEFTLEYCQYAGCSIFWNVDDVSISYAAPGCAPTPTPSPTPFPQRFVDVPPTNPFYFYIGCLDYHGVISGYQCGGPGEPCPGLYFRPGANITRAQVAKIVANAAGFQDAIPSTQQTFADVPPSDPFWVFIERLALPGRGYISGYICGSPPAGPCVPPGNRPYFLGGNDVTRGQLAKIVANAAGYQESIPSGQQSFEDMPPTNPFWLYVERVALHGVISGYGCGSPPAGPCVPPGNRPYFVGGNSATRAQTAKIVANGFFPGCPGPSPTPSPTRTPSPTPIPTCGVGSDYRITATTGAGLDPGTALVPNSAGDEVLVPIALPFSYSFYGQPFTSTLASSNGFLEFVGTAQIYTNTCLPNAGINDAIFAYWDDLVTSGIYTATSGSAPNRIFNIEWRGTRYGAGAVDFEVRLWEGQERFDIVYGPVDLNGASATVGVQQADGGGLHHTQYSCNAASLQNGLQLMFQPNGCGAPTATPSATGTPTTFPTATDTPTTTLTATPTRLLASPTTTP